MYIICKVIMNVQRNFPTYMSMYIYIIYIYIYIYIIIQVISNSNIPLHCVSWGVPNHQMVYNICFIPKTKRTYIYKQYQFLKHFSVNLFMRRHFETSSSRLFNKLAELALAISKFSHKVKSHYLVPQMYICPFIDYVILAIFSQFLYVVRKLCTFLT